jgi:N6-adenosine-specific RNA methylase IME4
MNKRYSIIYCDPPWDYKGQTQHKGLGKGSSGGASNHYGTLTLEQLKGLDIRGIAEKDCLLFLWSTSPHLDQAIDLMKSWGFQWATVGFVWDKQRVNPGFYTMSQVELCLIGKMGKIPTPRGARNVRQFLSEMRGDHSAKPVEVRNRIDLMFPTQSKIELFAREKAVGWDAWGEEVDSDIVMGGLPVEDKDL